jgi:hypothetical protein
MPTRPLHPASPLAEDQAVDTSDIHGRRVALNALISRRHSLKMVAVKADSAVVKGAVKGGAPLKICLILSRRITPIKAHKRAKTQHSIRQCEVK